MLRYYELIDSPFKFFLQDSLCIHMHVLIGCTIIVEISLNYTFGNLSADFGVGIEER